MLKERTCHRILRSICGREQLKEAIEMMMNLILFIAGICLGVPLGWAVLFLLTMRDLWPKEPKSKEDWKVM